MGSTATITMYIAQPDPAPISADGSDRPPPCSRGPPIHVSSRCGLCLQGGSVIAAVMPCDRPGRSYALSQGSAQLEYLTPASLFHIGHAR